MRSVLPTGQGRPASGPVGLAEELGIDPGSELRRLQAARQFCSSSTS